MAAAPQWPNQETPQEEPGPASKATNGTSSVSFDAETQMSVAHRDTGDAGQRQPTDHQTASVSDMDIRKNAVVCSKLIIIVRWTQTEHEEDEDERYYWEREPEENTSVTTQTQLWHQAHWMGTKAVEGTIGCSGFVLNTAWPLSCL